MRKVISLLAIFALLSTSALAFQPEITMLTEDEISKLSDEKLLATYVDIVIEVEASRTFHATSGFTPKDYKAFKELLRYRIKIIKEIRGRGLEVPVTE